MNIKSLPVFFVAITFYSFAMEIMRVKFGGFSFPPVLLPFFLIFIFKINKIYKLDKAFFIFCGLYGFFLFLVILSSIINSPEDSVVSIFKYVFCFVVFLIVYIVGKTMKHLERDIAVVIVFSSLLVAIHVWISSFILNSSFLSGSLFLITEEGKNQIAAYLAILCSINFAYIVNKTNVISKFLLVLSFFIHFYALFYTFSRSALISFFIASIVLVLSSNRSILEKLKIFSLFIIVLILGLSVISSVSDDKKALLENNINSIVEFKDQGESTSISVRSGMINDGLNMFYESPIIGNGPNSFFERFGVASHNTYIQLLSEIGVLGTISFLSMVMFTLYYSAKNNVLFFSATLCLFIAMVFQNISDSMFAYFLIALSLMKFDFSVNQDKSRCLT